METANLELQKVPAPVKSPWRGSRAHVVDSVGFLCSLDLFRWLVNSPWSQAMNSAEWVFPAVQSLHFIGFAMSIGTIAIVDFRLLGFGKRYLGAAELAADLAPWTLAGIAVMLITGPLMFSTDAVSYHFESCVSVQDALPDVGPPLSFHAASPRRPA